ELAHTLRVEETAINASGPSKPATSAATPPVVPPPPENTAVPTITGTPQQGETLTEHNGTWTGEPSKFEYQWLQCNNLGEGCLPISGAKGSTYKPTAIDVEHTIAVQETAINAGGASKPATSKATAVVAPPPPPGNVTAPSIEGKAQQGQTLSAQNGTWTNEPTKFTYLWKRCDKTGATCATVTPEVTTQTYALTASDVGSTLRVLVTAENLGGASEPATSAQSAVVAQPIVTFGKTTIGASTDTFLAERKRVSRYALTEAGTVSKLSVYLAPTKTTGQQVVKGVIYADSSSAPGALLATSEQLTFKSTNTAGWYDLVFGTPVKLAAGNYWLGAITGATSNVASFRYDSVTGARDWNANKYASGPSNPFGAVTVDAKQASLYATYTPG
ncbi:MAG TPA: hypothetical protein VNZ05_04165, partial [Solirubrobacteraceae bacterium]|nr:hypothetical protein [Solirubrobacteraceae bacterium]